MSAEKDHEPAHSQASMPAGAVFLSYASEDAVAAERIATALRTAGIEVWFDKSELRGGDAWDHQIRQQIHDCRLFIAVISANSERRDEGYFRREWALAADRTRDMAYKRAFLLPVVVDDTPERGASVPDKFHELQWTRLPDGQAPDTFVERIQRLLSPAASPARAAGMPMSPSSTGVERSKTVGSPPWHSKPVLWVIGAALAVAVAYFLVDKFWVSRRAASSAASTAAVASTQLPAEKSIAVLPFADLSEKHDQEYFADGMAEEVLNSLADIPGLRVIGRTSSFQFRGKSLDARTIGSQLQVAYLLEGSVRRSNDQVRVTAQLLSTKDGTHRWSDTFKARTDDVLQVQDAIAAGISRALEVAIVGLGVKDPAAASAEAYDLYMRGLHSLDTSSREGCERAIGLFTQVLRLQPNSERALISLARAHECIGYGDWTTPDAGFEQSREFATRTLQINPHSADAHLVLAAVYLMHDFDWAAAQQEIEAAAKLAEPDARGLTVAARLSLALGQFDRAITLLNEAISRDPLDPLIYDILGDTYFRSGLFDKSETMYRRCLEIDPEYLVEHYYLSNAIMMQGRLQEALSESDKGSPGDGGYEAGRALIFHAMGRSLEADEALKRLIVTNGSEWPYEVARVYAFRGELDSAFAWLDRAYQRRNTDLYYVKGDPLFRSLRGDTRYTAFLRKMNLPE
jgi:TolB-like protein/Flp pilus assembly protein TadD